MPKQTIAFTDETFKKLKDFIVEKYGSQRALSITVNQAVEAWIKAQRAKK